jgi:hypothetical protein
MLAARASYTRKKCHDFFWNLVEDLYLPFYWLLKTVSCCCLVWR